MVLDAALTGEVWADRKLGGNESVKLPMNMVFMATGNNVQVKGDLSRRTLRCRLDPKQEFPEKRQDFKHPRLLPWVKQQRPRLVVAALTILQSYQRSDARAAVSNFGSFEGWSDLVRSSLIWLGMADPVESQRALLSEAEPDREAHIDLLCAWFDLFKDKPMTVQQLLALTTIPLSMGEPSDEDLQKQQLRDALELLTGGDLNPRVVAQRALSSRRGRIVAGYKLVRRARGNAGHRWACIRASEV